MLRDARNGLLFGLIALLAIADPTFARPLSDTGQTKCYNYTEIPCPHSGEDLYGQDGNYLISPPSHTKLDAEGNDLPDSATSWVMVRDNVAGLIWEVKTDDGSIHDKDDTYSWEDAQNVFIAQVNAERFGGYFDWRLPTPKELSSVTMLGSTDPAADTAYFPNCRSSHYWSGTTHAYNPVNAWFVGFGIGHVYNDSKTNHYYVRCVRGGSSRFFEQLILNMDGTVTDTATGLMWQQDGPGTNWQGALSHAENLALAGYDDWRLPNAKELQSIVEYGQYDPAIDTAYFPNCRSSYYWSSSSYVDHPDFAFGVFFYSGYVGGYGKATDGYVRCVRGGSCRLFGHLILLTPAQGSGWLVGESQTITWDKQSIGGNVAISLSREGGKEGTFTDIVVSTENDGTYNWIVTGPSSVNCVLKIEPLQDTSKSTSQGLFSIYGLPSAITGSASAIGGDMATLNGTVNPGFLPTAVGFEWGEDETYGNEITATQSTLTGGEAQNVTGSLDGLTFATTYHYRVKATNSAGTSYGEDKVFTTEAVLPSVTTITVTSIGPNTAQGGGEVTADGGAEVTERGICWGTSPNPTTANDKTMNGTGIGSFTSSMTGLAPGTTYHVRAYATSSAGTAYGSDVPFTTLVLAPTAGTDPATSVGATTATLNGTVNPNGASATVVFEYGTDTNYGSTVTASQSPLTGGTAQPVTATISGLAPATTYHFRVTAMNVEGSANGEDRTFTTGTDVPTVTTAPVSSIGSTSASCGGAVTSSGGADVTSRGVCWGTSANPTIVDDHTSDGTGAGEFTRQIIDLSPSTSYHVRAYATNSAGTGYGADIPFSTSKAAPIIEIQSGADTLISQKSELASFF